MAEVPTTLPRRVTDIDAEVRDGESSRLLARDRADAADARLDFCLGIPSPVEVSFIGASRAVQVTALTSSWPISDAVPLRWGPRARAGMAWALSRRRAPVDAGRLLLQTLGVQGTTTVPLSVEPGNCTWRGGPGAGRGRGLRMTGIGGVCARRGGGATEARRALRRGRDEATLEIEPGQLACGWWRPGRWAPRAAGEAAPPAPGPARSRKWRAPPGALRLACPPRARGVPPWRLVAADRPRPGRARASVQQAVIGRGCERIDGRNLLAADSAKAVVAGAGKLTMIGADVASEGDRIGGFIEVPEGACALVMGRTTPTISDIDLYAFEDDGDTFAADESPDAEPAVLLCPPHPRRLYVVARVMSGAGVIALGVQTVPRVAADAVARAVEGAGGGRRDRAVEAWTGWKRRSTRRASSVPGRRCAAGRARRPTGNRGRGTIEPNRCLDVLVTPSEEVPAMEVIAEDAGGRVVARARDRGRDRTLLLCSGSPVELTVVVRPRGSAGLVALVVGRSAVGAEAELSSAVRIERVFPTLDLPQARADHERRIAGRGLGAAKTVATGSARVGVRTAFPVDAAGWRASTWWRQDGSAIAPSLGRRALSPGARRRPGNALAADRGARARRRRGLARRSLRRRDGPTSLPPALSPNRGGRAPRPPACLGEVTDAARPPRAPINLEAEADNIPLRAPSAARVAHRPRRRGSGPDLGWSRRRS